MRTLKRRDDKLKKRLYRAPMSKEEQGKAYEDGVRRGMQKRLDELLKKNDIAEYEYQKKKMNEELERMFGKNDKT